MSWELRAGELTSSKTEGSINIFSPEHHGISKDQRSHPVQGSVIFAKTCFQGASPFSSFPHQPQLWVFPALVQTLALLGLPRLCHSSFALQHCGIGVHTSFRASESTVLHLHVPPSVLSSLHLCCPHCHCVQPWDKPSSGTCLQRPLRKKTQRLPRIWHFFSPSEQKSSHRKQSSSAWETTWGRLNREQTRSQDSLQNPPLLLQVLGMHAWPGLLWQKHIATPTKTRHSAAHTLAPGEVMKGQKSPCESC